MSNENVGALSESLLQRRRSGRDRHVAFRSCQWQRVVEGSDWKSLTGFRLKVLRFSLCLESASTVARSWREARTGGWIIPLNPPTQGKVPLPKESTP